MRYLNGTFFTRTDQDDKTRCYLDGLEIYDNQPESYPFSEGRLVFRSGQVHFQYRIADHLGNTVVLFEDKNDDGLLVDLPTDSANTEVLQRKLYYPFGMALRGTSPARPAVRQGYLYNGKEEVAGTGLYDYGARAYDPVVGRWLGVDPLAETMSSWSPYNYAFNNPISFTDPDGMSPDNTIYYDDSGNYLGETQDEQPDAIVIVASENISEFSKTISTAYLSPGGVSDSDVTDLRALGDSYLAENFDALWEKGQNARYPSGFNATKSSDGDGSWISEVSVTATRNGSGVVQPKWSDFTDHKNATGNGHLALDNRSFWHTHPPDQNIMTIREGEWRSITEKYPDGGPPSQQDYRQISGVNMNGLFNVGCSPC